MILNITFFDKKRTGVFLLILGLLVLVVVSQLNIHFLKKSHVNYIITFQRPIKVPHTFALDTFYSNTHKQIRIRGPVGKGEILIGSDFSSIQEFMEHMNKNAKIFKEVRCGIEITRFTDLKAAPADNVLLQNKDEYLLFFGVEDKFVKQAIDSLCISYQE